MQGEIDYAAFELGIARPRLRDDLRFSLRKSRHGPTYIIEDETNSKFYRVGLAEYTFLSLLDGDTTVQSAIAATAAKLGYEAFNEAEAAALCKWLIDAGLADKRRHDQQQWQETQRRKEVARRMQWINPIMLKLPIGNPDAFVSQLSKYAGWITSPWAGFVWLVVCLAAVMLLLTRSDDWLTQTPILAPDNWLLLGLAWMGLRAVHETAHAVTCKRYGGRVREWGILFLVFFPLPYVDVTSSWRFPKRRSRILTSAAGMMAELFLAGIATFIWYHADPGLLRQNAFNVMLAASITTLLFNANPLMRFDGYHILADLLDAPNLWSHGRQFLRSIGRKFFFGLNSGNPPWRPSQARLVRTYGIAAGIWKVLILLSLSLAALSLLDGIGLIIAVLACLLWVGVPTFQIVRFLFVGTETEQPDRRRFVVVCGGCLAVVVAIGLIVPAPRVISAPVVIQHDPLTVVRNTSAGFIRQLPVKPGQRVAAGDLLCRLENIDLQAERRILRAQLRASEQRVRSYQSAGQPAAVRIELESTRDLRRRLAELSELIDSLVITAPHDGVVIAGDLQQRLGTYIQPGSEIVTIGGDGGRTAIALVSQDASQSLADLQGHPADIRIWGSAAGPLAAKINKIHPRAQTSLPHFSFASPVGGDLAVLAAESNDPDAANWVLAKPHVQLEIAIDQDADINLLSGQTGQATIRARQGFLGEYLITKLTRFISDRIQKTHGL